MIQQAVILAAGRGTRLGHLTADRPKSMLPVLGRPILMRVMDRLYEAGVRRFVVVIGDRDDAVAAYLKSAQPPDCRITIAVQARPTGTVDALKCAWPYITGPFLLSSVDNLTPLAHVKRLIDTFVRTPHTIATLSLLPASPAQIRRSSGVRIDGERITRIEEKPANPGGTYASIMLYAFDTAIVDYLDRVAISPRGEREIASAIQASIAGGRLVSYAIADSRLHLTRERDLLAITKHFLEQDPDTHILSEIPDSVHLMPPVRIDPNVTVGQSVRIGPNVYLESGAVIGDGVALDNALVLSGATVAAGERCSGCIVHRHTRIPASENA